MCHAVHTCHVEALTQKSFCARNLEQTPFRRVLKQQSCHHEDLASQYVFQVNIETRNMSVTQSSFQPKGISQTHTHTHISRIHVRALLFLLTHDSGLGPIRRGLKAKRDRCDHLRLSNDNVCFHSGELRMNNTHTSVIFSGSI